LCWRSPGDENGPRTMNSGFCSANADASDHRTYRSLKRARRRSVGAGDDEQIASVTTFWPGLTPEAALATPSTLHRPLLPRGRGPASLRRGRSNWRPPAGAFSGIWVGGRGFRNSAVTNIRP
jgi:hypothetical protein